MVKTEYVSYLHDALRVLWGLTALCEEKDKPHRDYFLKTVLGIKDTDIRETLSKMNPEDYEIHQLAAKITRPQLMEWRHTLKRSGGINYRVKANENKVFYTVSFPLSLPLCPQKEQAV